MKVGIKSTRKEEGRFNFFGQQDKNVETEFIVLRSGYWELFHLLALPTLPKGGKSKVASGCSLPLEVQKTTRHFEDMEIWLHFCLRSSQGRKRPALWGEKTAEVFFSHSWRNTVSWRDGGLFTHKHLKDLEANTESFTIQVLSPFIKSLKADASGYIVFCSVILMPY